MAESRRRQGDARANISSADDRGGKGRRVGGAAAADARDDMSGEKQGGGGGLNNDDLKNIEFETSEDVEVTPTFDAMGLREELIRGIYAYGKR